MSKDEQAQVIKIEPKNKPPPPQFRQTTTLDSANAKNVEHMLSDDPEKVPYIGYLTPRDVKSNTLLHALAVSKTFKFVWADVYAVSSTKYSCSRDGFRSKQIEEMSKPSNIVQDAGFFGGMREKLKL